MAVLTTVLRAGVAEAERCSQDFTEVPVGGQACGLGIGNDRRLLLDSTPVSDILYGWNKAPAERQSLLIFPPSPKERFVVVAGCYVACAWPFLVDRQERTATAFEAGKYGPDKWVSWSRDDRHALLINSTDGVSWLHSIDVSGRRVSKLPPGNSSIIINKNSVRWLSDSVFSADVAINTCLGSPVSCDSSKISYHAVTFDVSDGQLDITGINGNQKGEILPALLGDTQTAVLSFLALSGVEAYAPVKDLYANPFIYGDRVIAVPARFIQMISKNEAIFGDANDPFSPAFAHVSDMEASRFSAATNVLLAVRVLGNKQVKTPAGGEVAAPSLQFIDSYSGDVSRLDLENAVNQAKLRRIR
jgi:hypothetical protein